MIISIEDYRSSVLGCWMGKNIGGTLGAPMEWKREVNHVTFYTQELGGNPLPNDDLDLQLVWLTALEEKGIDINARTLGEYWLTYITPHWAEYGTGKINMRSGLMPPLSGMENNPYKDSCGAFIRSEIWACMAPGCPEVAVKYAYEDAIVDHGNGEGMYAEIFCAAMESAAFVEKDIPVLIDIGLSYIPETCGVSKVVKLVKEEYAKKTPYLEVRDRILSGYRSSYSGFGGICREDVDKGFADGPQGWDVPANIGFILIGLLYGLGDFEKSLCMTVHCGEDTDCTAATLGSIYGILHGIGSIPEKWIQPIGNSIKTMCLNLGELQGQLPADIHALTARVEKIAKQVILRYYPQLELSETRATDFSDVDKGILFARSGGDFLYQSLTGPKYSFDFFEVSLDYADGPYVKDNTMTRIILKIVNRYKIPASINIKWYADEGWTIGPAKNGKVHLGTNSGSQWEQTVHFLTSEVSANVNRFVLELTIDGRHSVMLVPVVLLNGNFSTGRY